MILYMCMLRCDTWRFMCGALCVRCCKCGIESQCILLLISHNEMFVSISACMCARARVGLSLLKYYVFFMLSRRLIPLLTDARGPHAGTRACSLILWKWEQKRVFWTGALWVSNLKREPGNL
jgi:hypothetical protein